jgi:hypothetical protein
MAEKKAKTVVPTRATTTKSAKKAVKKKKVEKRPPKQRGRKAWVPDLEKIERYAMQAMDDKDIAALCGIHHQGFCTKKTEIPELKEALDRGRSKGIQIASGELLKMVLKGDRDATKFYLERKGGWKQTNVLEKKKSIKDLSDEEILELLANGPASGI